MIQGFDTSKFYLGSICKRGHVFADTQLCVRSIFTRNCRECMRARTKIQTLEDKEKDFDFSDKRVSCFFKKISKIGDCHEWTASKNDKGYGCFNAPKRIYAHRYSYILHYGEIPDGFFVCHKCDNPSCVNPAHLFLGTVQDNCNDMRDKNRCKFGVNHHNAELNEMIVVNLRKHFANGLSMREAALIEGVNPSTASKAIRGVTWRRVPFYS